MSIVLGIEPTVATAIDLRTGNYASRRRAPYPRSLVNLGGILREPKRACDIARELGIRDYPVDPALPFEILIHDRLASDFTHEEEIPAHEPDYEGPVTYYKGLRYGESAEDTAAFIRAQAEARIVIIPAIFSGSRTEIVETARIVKAANPKLLVVAGGTYASMDSLFLLESGWIDAVVIGEGWLALPALVHSHLQTGRFDDIPGVVFRWQSGEVVDNTKRHGFYPKVMRYDAIPMPAWDLLDFYPYDFVGLTHLGETPAGQRVAPIDSEIGCGQICRFCASGYLNQGYLVKKSARRIFDEVCMLAEKFDRNVIHFDSDNPLVDNARSLEFFGLMRDYNQLRLRAGEEPVHFAFPNGTAPWTFRNPNMIPAMLEAGLFHISIAVESGSPRTLKTLGKARKVPELAYQAIRGIRHWESRAKRFGHESLVIETFIMLGVPGETTDDVGQTVALCERLSQDLAVIVAPFYYAPLHGTPLFDAFFDENPKASKLSWPILGWLGTEKKDAANLNRTLAHARTTLAALSRDCSSAGFVRL